jgi:two-component system chemotaxis sensor kinase CheA
VVLAVSDDGRGLDVTKIRKVAIARGLIAPDAPVSQAGATSLICAPGFSTADHVGELSGRGLGLDVVRRSITNLGGALQVQSRPGAGVRFTLSIPLRSGVLKGW